MSNRRDAIIIVIRCGSKSKTRLAPILSADERNALTLIMFEAMLSALSKTEMEIYAVSPSPSLLAAAREAGAKTLSQAPYESLNAGFLEGRAAAFSAGAETVAYLPGDLPLLDIDELNACIDVARRCGAAIVRSHSGYGTGALVQRKPAAIEPMFGPESFSRHMSSANARGVMFREVQAPSLAFDIDTPADFVTLAENSKHLTSSLALRLSTLRKSKQSETV